MRLIIDCYSSHGLGFCRMLFLTSGFFVFSNTSINLLVTHIVVKFVET